MARRSSMKAVMKQANQFSQAASGAAKKSGIGAIPIPTYLEVKRSSCTHEGRMHTFPVPLPLRGKRERRFTSIVLRSFSKDMPEEMFLSFVDSPFTPAYYPASASLPCHFANHYPMDQRVAIEEGKYLPDTLTIMIFTNDEKFEEKAAPWRFIFELYE